MHHTPTTFLYYETRPPRNLHSFPTRRSSDLRCPTTRSSAMRSGRSGSCSCAPLTGGRRSSTTCSTGRERRDRKSTRLNSSHITISYAVFCLKKKKYNKKDDTHYENHLTADNC